MLISLLIPLLLILILNLILIFPLLTIKEKGVALYIHCIISCHMPIFQHFIELLFPLLILILLPNLFYMSCLIQMRRQQRKMRCLRAEWNMETCFASHRKKGSSRSLGIHNPSSSKGYSNSEKILPNMRSIIWIYSHHKQS